MVQLSAGHTGGPLQTSPTSLVGTRPDLRVSNRSPSVIPQVDIARVVGIDDDTLRKHFREAIDTGSAGEYQGLRNICSSRRLGNAVIAALRSPRRSSGRRLGCGGRETVINEHAGRIGVDQASLLPIRCQKVSPPSDRIRRSPISAKSGGNR
jgi:hypothetical protein